MQTQRVVHQNYTEDQKREMSRLEYLGFLEQGLDVVVIIDHRVKTEDPRLSGIRRVGWSMLILRGDSLRPLE